MTITKQKKRKALDVPSAVRQRERGILQQLVTKNTDVKVLDLDVAAARKRT